MDVRNRMADIVKLRCNACQDFLKMIIDDDWRQKLYDKAKIQVETNGKWKDKYISVYEKMREIGVANYSIDDMDVTLISEVVHGCKDIAPTDERTRKCIEQLTEDRNLTSHSGENEGPEELYRRGLLDLYNLKRFVSGVDKFETSIEDDKRKKYLSTYGKRIDELKDTLDDECIPAIQKKKKIEKDIRQLLDCKDDRRTWLKMEKNYNENCWKFEKDPDTFFEFMIAASDAGITAAHIRAINGETADKVAFLFQEKTLTQRNLLICRKCDDYADFFCFTSSKPCMHVI